MNDINGHDNILISSDSDSDSSQRPKSKICIEQQDDGAQSVEILLTSDSDKENDDDDSDEIVFGKFEKLAQPYKNKSPKVTTKQDLLTSDSDNNNDSDSDEIVFGKYEKLPQAHIYKRGSSAGVKHESDENDEIVFGKYEILEKQEPLSNPADTAPCSSQNVKERSKLHVKSLSTDEEETEQKPSVSSKKSAKKPRHKKSAIADILTSDDEEQQGTDVKKARKRRSERKLSDKTEAKRPKGNGKEENNDVEMCMFLGPTWKDYELLAERTNVRADVARNLINLIEEGNTIPFIARYRRNVVGNLPPEELRTLKENYDKICNLKKRMSSVLKGISKVGKLDERLKTSIYASRTIEELDHLHTPFKQVGNKRSLAERAKSLGLEQPALDLLNNRLDVVKDLLQHVDSKVEGIQTVKEVESKLVHIMSAEIATDFELIQFMRNLKNTIFFKLSTKKIKRETKLPKTEDKKKGADSLRQELKFELYFDFSQHVHLLKPHQILAINRGESLKFLSVKLEIPPKFKTEVFKFCENKWTQAQSSNEMRDRLFQAALKDCYNRYIVAFICRVIRSELKEIAENEACKVFSENLKHLLLTTPLKGKEILGIDPGFSNGCKLALISATGSVLAYNVIYPHTTRRGDRGENVVKQMLLDFNCDTIAIGNGTACRETEEWICRLIKLKFFYDLNVRYVIVNEDGASIYSCSPEAKKEFDDLDPNIISAVSLARRLQDPMAELVKIEPCHLGIGMYQLDLKKRQLEDVLNDVVSECVSFVGVDLNTASQCLLKRVAGLTDKRATQIINYREQNGPFTRRRELLEVYGIGERIFEQCAGFLRVCPVNSTGKTPESTGDQKYTTPLDATIIHPESYRPVRCLLKNLHLSETEIGTADFIQKFNILKQNQNFTQLAEKYAIDNENMNLIVDALSKPLNYDFRMEDSSSKPLFRTDIKTFDMIKVGCELTGRIANVTSFGAFVDIGVNVDGLLHKSKCKRILVHLGQQVQVRVVKIDPVKKHISLELIKCN